MRKTREAAVFVHRGGRVLVAKRSGDGFWNVVAGQVEDDESFVEGAARELYEEARLIAPLTAIGVPERYEVDPAFRHLYPPGEYTVTVAPFAAQAPDEWEPTLNHEHTEYRWCSVDDALELLRWPEVKAALRVAAARVRSSK
jgi:dATP pyrophosphohydrolase